MKIIFTILLAWLSTQVFALDPNHFTITRITAPYFIVDGNSPASVTKAYAGFEIKNNSNSGVTYTGLKFTITSIGTSVAGQNYSVVSPASGIINVGTLAPGQTKVCYYYVSYPANVTPQATFNIQLGDNTASSKTQSFIIYNRSSISANAGGTATQSLSNQDLIGGIIVDDVTYVVGNVQNGDESDFQVAVSPQFDPTKIRLLSTQVISSSVPGIPVGATDSLYFITGNGSNGATMTIRWTFRITDYNFTTYLLPCAGATSGSTNYKYALNTSLGSGTPVTISASANPLTITKTSDKTLYGANTAAIFTVTIQNPGAYGITIDKLTDELPAGFSFQSLHAASQVTSANSTSLPNTGATGTITFEGGVFSGGNTSYYVPAGGSIILKYTATAGPATASNLLTTTRDFIGILQVGSAQNTVSVSATLPVTLLSFKGNYVNKNILLSWMTTQEKNFKSFIVEKNNSNNVFSPIGTVTAAGTTAATNTYSFIDSSAVPGLNYYRLKMVDADQRFQYGPVIAVSVNEKEEKTMIRNIYPNPVTDHTTISITTGANRIVTIYLTDMSGKVCRTRNISCHKGNNELLIDGLSSLQPGVYLIKVVTDEGSSSEKLIKYP